MEVLPQGEPPACPALPKADSSNVINESILLKKSVRALSGGMDVR